MVTGNLFIFVIVTTTTDYEQVQLHIVCMTLILVLLFLPLDTVEASCTFEDKEVCEGKIVKEIGKSLVKICIEGKLRIKPRKKITPWPGYGGSCMWYGEVLCDGAVVQVGLQEFIYVSHTVFLLQDLYRWWFLSKCSKSKMSVVSRSWLDVTSDRRYKPNQL